jgi:hypothetical protein
MSPMAADAPEDGVDEGHTVVRLADGTCIMLNDSETEQFLAARDRLDAATQELDAIVGSALAGGLLAHERPLSGGGNIFGEPPPSLDLDYTMLDHVRDRHQASPDGGHDA